MTSLLLVLLAFGCFSSMTYGQRVRTPCPSPLNSITDCPDTGCGNVDPHLNRQSIGVDEITRFQSGEQQPSAAVLLAYSRYSGIPVSSFTDDEIAPFFERENLTRIGLQCGGVRAGVNNGLTSNLKGDILCGEIDSVCF